jgi:hypothetical protein
MFRFQIDPDMGSTAPRFEYQLGMKRVNEDVDEHKDKRVRISPVVQVRSISFATTSPNDNVQRSSRSTMMANSINQRLLHTLRSNQVFIQSQSQMLLEAQQKIDELQSAQKMAENKQEILLRELQTIKVMTQQTSSTR